ncbi:FAD-dependent oxidoreductase [Streptomyces sp. NPDC019990]|uniref:FAD-dependent oxidoreductase n=1 Tax=Streptomyces sp. NPDC019990 TaxID=3154693 RepID=UPI0033CE5CEC
MDQPLRPQRLHGRPRQRRLPALRRAARPVRPAGPARLLKPGPRRAGKPLPEQGDLVVIGGGLTGPSTACHAARKGTHVVLVEKDKVGSGASGRNGGMCTQGITISRTTLLSKSDLRAELGSDSYHGALLDPLSAHLQRGLLTRTGRSGRRPRARRATRPTVAASGAGPRSGRAGRRQGPAVWRGGSGHRDDGAANGATAGRWWRGAARRRGR